MKSLSSIRKSLFAKKLFSDNSGVAIIEMAIILPILLVMVFGVIEFGNYYLKEMVVQRAASAATSYVQTAHPNDLAASNAAAINDRVASIVQNSGSGFVNSLKVCGNHDDWTIDPASCSNVYVARKGSGVRVDQPYNVQLVVAANYQTITALPSLVGLTMPSQIVARSRFVVPSEVNPPTDGDGKPISCTAWQHLNYDTTTGKYICDESPFAIPPNCTGTNKFLQWNGTAFTCARFNANSVIDSSSCHNANVNGLKWNGSKYVCVILPKVPVDVNGNASACNTNNISNGGNTIDFVQFNGTDYTCSTINKADLKGADGTNGVNGTSGGGAILCSKDIRYRFSGPGNYYWQFTADECGGTLPDANYLGSLKRQEICNGSSHMVIINADEQTGGIVGRDWTPLINGPAVGGAFNNPCTWPDGRQAHFEVVYVHK